MYQVRRNIFETNSSSMHSLAISSSSTAYLLTKEQELEAIESFLRRDGRLDLKDMEMDFGWGWAVLDNFYDKLAYILADLVSEQDLADDEANPDLEFILQAIDLPQVKGFRLPRGNIYDSRKPSVGSIDHQSCGLISRYLAKQKDKGVTESEALHRLLFDSSMVIIIDNDNCPSSAEEDFHCTIIQS